MLLKTISQELINVYVDETFLIFWLPSVIIHIICPYMGQKFTNISRAAKRVNFSVVKKNRFKI